MRSPQPGRETGVTFLLDVIVTIAAPVAIALYVDALFTGEAITINLGGLVVVLALCAWFADVERRRGWIRGARSSKRTR